MEKYLFIAFIITALVFINLILMIHTVLKNQSFIVKRLKQIEDKLNP